MSEILARLCEFPCQIHFFNVMQQVLPLESLPIRPSMSIPEYITMISPHYSNNLSSPKLCCGYLVEHSPCLPRKRHHMIADWPLFHFNFSFSNLFISPQELLDSGILSIIFTVLLIYNPHSSLGIPQSLVCPFLASGSSSSLSFCHTIDTIGLYFLVR